MKRLALMAGVACLTGLGFAATPANPESNAVPPVEVTPPDPCLQHLRPADQQRRLADRLFHRKRWRRARPVAGNQNRLEAIRNCAPIEHRPTMRYRWREAKAEFYRHRRFMVLWVEVWTPFGDSAIPTSITACESGDDYGAENASSTAGGRYQIIDSTWYAYGGSYHPGEHPAAEAPPWEQDKVAHAIWLGSGSGAWVCA